MLESFAGNVYSQNGEDGIIAEVTRRLGLTTGHAVEIGGNDGRWMSNTAHLIEQGWSGLFIEADWDLYEKSIINWATPEYAEYPHRVRHQHERVDATNVNQFVTDECDLLSTDTDGGDYAIFCGMKARPSIVVIEIDSSVKPPSEYINSDGGVGYWTMMVAALERGYLLVAHTGNLILVHQRHADLFPECKPHPLIEWERYFNRGWLDQ